MVSHISCLSARLLGCRSAARVISLLLAAVCLLGLFSCGKNGEKVLESSELEQSVVMTVDGFEVPLELYRYIALNYRRDYESTYSPDVWETAEGPALLEELKENTAASIVRLYATLSLARDYGISPDDAYVNDALDAAMKDVYEETADNDFKAFPFLHLVYERTHFYRFRSGAENGQYFLLHNGITLSSILLLYGGSLSCLQEAVPYNLHTTV